MFTCDVKQTFIFNDSENKIGKNKKASYWKIDYMVLYGQPIALIFVISNDLKYNIISNAVG